MSADACKHSHTSAMGIPIVRRPRQHTIPFHKAGHTLADCALKWEIQPRPFSAQTFTMKPPTLHGQFGIPRGNATLHCSSQPAQLDPLRFLNSSQDPPLLGSLLGRELQPPKRDTATKEVGHSLTYAMPSKTFLSFLVFFTWFPGTTRRTFRLWHELHLRHL